MKITLKTVILVALFIFYLVIILSNFAGYEGMQSEISDETNVTSKPTMPSASVNLVKTVVKKSNTEDNTLDLPEMNQ